MFKNKVVLVTGGSRGIGSEIVKAFAKENAIVIFTYVKSKDMSEELIRSLSATNQHIYAYHLDASKPDTMVGFIDELVRKHEKIDVLINNAGVVTPGRIGEISDESYDYQMNVNVHSVFKLTNSAVKYMPKGGRIISISSILGLRGAESMSVYSAAKFAIQGFTRSWARDLSAKGILVNCVSPGSVDTDLNPDTPDNTMADWLKSNTPIGRFLTPKEIAYTVLFLSGDFSIGITGTNITVDGGFCA